MYRANFISQRATRLIYIYSLFFFCRFFFRFEKKIAKLHGREVSLTFSIMAPFKLRFSKMSKSRSNGSKGSRSSSVECEEPGQQQQQQQQQPNNSNIQALVGCNSRPETPSTETNNVVAIGNESGGFPDSPPPSYEHVLEEVTFTNIIK